MIWTTWIVSPYIADQRVLSCCRAKQLGVTTIEQEDHARFMAGDSLKVASFVTGIPVLTEKQFQDFWSRPIETITTEVLAALKK